MGKNLKRRNIDKIRFSIGAKLVIIISIIVLLSLGSITALVSWLVRQDLRISAEENNFEINRRSSVEAELVISKMRSEALIHIRTLGNLENPQAEELTEYFFDHNPMVAAMFFSAQNQEDRLLINQRFFNSKEVESSLADSFYEQSTALMRQASAGNTLLMNAAPHFNIALVALFFPWQRGGGLVLFSPETLSDTFGMGLNQSYLLNDSGDLIIHSDFELVRSGVNVADRSFIREIKESTDRSKQILAETDFGVTRKQTKSSNKSSVPREISIENQGDPGLYNTVKRNVFEFFKIATKAKPEEVQSADSGAVRQFVAYTKLNLGGSTVITSIEYDRVFEGIEATTRRNIYLTTAVLLISIMLVWFFAKTISIPIKALASAAGSIESGVFEVDLPNKGRDEIGVLNDSFRKMSSALGIFGRFTNRDIAVKAMRGEITPGGLPKHATIFFSDIREFTSKSENFVRAFGTEASDRIVYWLNNYLTRMVECVEKTGGAVDKFIGDAVMAHWGTAYTSGSPQKDAYNCVCAALMMRKAVYELNKKCGPSDPGNPRIQIGCGINTGIVTAGQIGSDLRMEYTVIGDPVNLASRVESLNKPLGTDILITENTWELVRDDFITEEMPSVTVKGKEKPVRIFAVINLLSLGKGVGPNSLAGVRKIMGIATPNISAVNLDEDEKKYKIEPSGNRNKK